MRKALIATSLLLLSGGVFAEYTGPSAEFTAPLATIQQLLKTGQDNQHATVQGTIVRHIRGNHYLFADKTGQMNVEIKKHRLPTVKFDAKTQLSLTGKLDKDWNKPLELEVKQVKILP